MIAVDDQPLSIVKDPAFIKLIKKIFAVLRTDTHSKNFPLWVNIMRITSIFRLQPQWNRAIADAEKLVGYTGSFLSLQCLLTDEMAQLALNARKLFSRQQHPLFKTA
uniref:Uncharacterized protein n=1 Tax=Romanomermis culicivorax TaxID=13658 RepID=A0A915HMC2_ROMCU